MEASTTPRPNGTSEGYPCPAGFYCLSGDTEPRACPLGTYNPNLAQDNCTDCIAGYMCDQLNLTTPVPCKEGKYPAKIVKYYSLQFSLDFL